ncbi:hypothetical protein [Burkholderia gladioli]|uniref:hypothetical protein n=1 Tax=Burkholderia gladioli TaxID=28095 RepID=UPI002FE0F3C8
MDYEVKRLHARVNALEVALIAALKDDPKVWEAVGNALTTEHDLAVQKRDTPVAGGFQTHVEREPRQATDKDAEDLKVTTLDALRRKFGYGA